MEYISFTQAANEIGITNKRLYKLADGGRIKWEHVAGLKVITREDLDKFIERRNK